MTVRYTNLPDNKDKPFGGAYSVHDSDLCAHRDLIINQFTLHNNSYLREQEDAIASINIKMDAILNDLLTN